MKTYQHTDTELEFHAKGTTIQFGDLIADGFDWGKAAYHIPILTKREQAWVRDTLNRKIEQRFAFRHIGVRNPGQFRHYMTATLNEQMEIYAPQYAHILSYGFNLIDGGKATNEKSNKGDSQSSTTSRVLNSDYPQNQVKGDRDYLKDGTDSRTEKDDINTGEEFATAIQTKAGIDALLDFNDRWQGIDIQILNKLEKHFSSFIQIDKGV